jgi:hypothetical protein
VDTVIAMIAFFALVASWFVLPSAPRAAVARTKTATTEPLAQAA